VRVVFLNQHYAPDEAATAQLLGDLGPALVAAGHEVSAICSSRGYADPGRHFPARETLDGVAVYRTWTARRAGPSIAGRLLSYLTYLGGAARVLAFHRKPDVVISLTTPPLIGWLGVVMAGLRGARSVSWVMDLYPDVAFELGALERDSMLGRLLTWISNRVLRRSSHVVAIGETMAERLREAGIARVTVIHNWADGEQIRPCPSTPHALREQWGWQDRFVILYSGNLGLAHEFDTILDAAERMRDKPRYLFAFVGSGSRRREVEAEATRRGLSNVVFRPPVPREQLPMSLTAGDLHLVTLRPTMPGLLVPSKIYGILAAGRPTLYIGPDVGEIAEILREGDCGRRIPAGDADAVVAAIREYDEDESLRGEAERRARQLFDARFTRERAMRSFMKLIAEGGENGWR